MNYQLPIDFHQPGFGSLFDELPLWSAPFGQLILQHVPLQRGWTYLDVGAGTGFLSMEIAQRSGSDSRVIAVDPWEEAISRFQTKVDALGLENIEIRQQDAITLDLPDGYVDVVLSNLGVNNFEDPQQVLNLLFRKTRSGGSLYLSTNLEGHMGEFYGVFRSTLQEADMPESVKALDGHTAHRGTVASLSERLEQTGYQVSEIHQESFSMRFVDGTALLRHFFIRLGFVQSWLALIPDDRRVFIFERLEQNLNSHAAQQGEIALTIPAACLVARKP